MGSIRRLWKFFGVEDDLSESFAVAEVDENDSSVIAAAMDPADEAGPLSDICFSQFVAMMRAFHKISDRIYKINKIIQIMKVNQEIEAEVVDLAFGGEGIARYEGAVVFVPFAAVGDKVRVKITSVNKSFYRGEIVEILEASKDRESATCPYYGECGGCQYQHIRYEAELAAKEKQLRDILLRMGKLENPEIRPILYGNPYGYRNRITVHNERGRVGFRAVDGRYLVDVEKCLIATDEVNTKLKKLREQRRPRPHYSVRADAVRGEAFHQTNELLAEKLQEVVCDAFEADIQNILEGYAGVGFFTQPLAKRMKKIIAVESDPRTKSYQSNISNIQWIEGTCEEHLVSARENLPMNHTACLVDPPREGLSEIVRNDLLELKFDQIVYLSCNPATLARDMVALSSVWKTVYFQPMDLFPRTAHLECLAVLKKR